MIFLGPCGIVSPGYAGSVRMGMLSVLLAGAAVLGSTSQIPPSFYQGIYLNPYAATNRKYMEAILRRLDEGVNVVVIDMKLDTGVIPYPSKVGMADRIGAVKPVIRHVDELMSKLRERRLYAIARLIVFKDRILAGYEGGRYAVVDNRGRIWTDKNGEVWVDPFCEEVWDYNLDIAVELAEIGFDEIQFDYLRFPSEGEVSKCVYRYRKEGQKKEETVFGFLRKARKRLAPLGVRVGVDVFGFSAWHESLPLEGQDIELIGRYADVVYPMLYPSHFGAFMNDLGAREREYAIVFESTKRAKERLAGTGADLVVYLQGFNWKAPEFGTEYVRNQIDAALRAGSSGWIIWHSASDYEATWEALEDRLPILRRRPAKLRIGELDFIPPPKSEWPQME